MVERIRQKWGTKSYPNTAGIYPAWPAEEVRMDDKIIPLLPPLTQPDTLLELFEAIEREMAKPFFTHFPEIRPSRSETATEVENVIKQN